MSDLEGLDRQMLAKGVGRAQRLSRLVDEIMDYKTVDRSTAEKLALAVLDEVEASSNAVKRDETGILSFPRCGVTVGEQGVGCRGTGDFVAHRIVAELSQTGTRVALAPTDMDDAGATVLPDGRFLVAKMEGMHSRLSDFPFLAGFHVARAAMRDVYVKGAVPLGLLVDIHLGDDADVGKLFDFTAGVSAVCDLAGCPILGGSTLRIGGDMVIGPRMTGGVAVFGLAERLFPRANVRAGDIIVMTEGSGGGTICTTAIYSARPEVIQETLNVKFLTSAKTLLTSSVVSEISCLADVTNGGIRADLYEIGEQAGCGAEVQRDAIESMINPRVRDLLEDTGVDPLGVSLDSLLIFCRPGAEGEILEELAKVRVKASIIGRVKQGRAVEIVGKDGRSELLPRFRESAYTPLKKVVESAGTPPTDFESSLRRCAEQAQRRKRAVVKAIREGRPVYLRE